jgi:peptidoglycan/xylan/chitin deacetylase (PgdA/CDA1 family)
MMSKLGYSAITFADVVKGFYGAIKLPQRCFAVTFDDGYLSVAEHAAPILDRYKFPATVFVVSDMVGRTNEWDIHAGRPIQPLMVWDSLYALQSAGWEIAGHTRTHPHLNQLHRTAALEELKSGKHEIEARIGSRVETFCYPYGDYSEATPELVQNAGFLGACTTRSGWATERKSPYLLPRVKISHRDDVAGLLYKLHLRPMLPTLRSARYRRKQAVQPG